MAPLGLSDELLFDDAGSARNALWLEFSSNVLVMGHQGYGGTATFNSKGTLGAMESVPAPTPLPGAFWLLEAGLLGRRHRPGLRGR